MELGKSLRLYSTGLYANSPSVSASLDAVLSRAVHHCPQAEDLWLMSAKEKWLADDVSGAREILEKAFVANPDSEKIWLAAVKLEAENGEYEVARELLTRARKVADTERIWMKSAVFERQQGQIATALSIIEAALKKYPKFAKFYMIQGQIHQANMNFAAARASFAAGLKACPKERTLWILASRLEEADGKSIKARALLDKARVVNPGSDVLWAEAIGVEERAGSAQQAKTVLARGLQDCPTSGTLWAMAIWAEPRPTRKARSADALRKCAGDAQVICAVARLFWAERKIEKARQWFARACATDADRGDCWGWWLRFEREHGTTVRFFFCPHLMVMAVFMIFKTILQEHQQEVINRCIAAEPHHGPVWQSISKDPANFGKKTKEIVELVANALE